MISTDLYRDLKSFGIKLLFIGDPGQLEPVGDNPNLMKSPNYVLSKIHRQAEGNPIIALASGVRNGTAVRLVPLQHNAHVFIKPKFTDAELLCSADQVICAKNATRSLLNSRIRAHLNHPSGTIIPGDKLICLRNNRQFRMFNGLICTVESIERDYFDHWICNLRDEADVLYENIPVWKAPLVGNLDPGTQPPRGLLYFDFGYAITCHKSQGSEWPHVLVYDEVMFKTDMRRWRYTAITRASEKLTYCI